MSLKQLFVPLVAVLISFSYCAGQEQTNGQTGPENSETEKTDKNDSSAKKSAKLTKKQTETVAEINSLITDAGLLFKKKSYARSARKVKSAKKKIIELVATGNEQFLKKLKHDYGRLKTAQGLLNDKGQNFKPLVPLKEMGELAKKNGTKGASGSSAKQVSFTKEVAPILVQKCGRCHVQGAKGGLSFASLTAMKKGSKNGPVLTVGDAASSSLYVLVESGEMPPRSKGFPKKELQTIKNWIAQGAPYDGNSEDDKLLDLVGGNGNRPPRRGR